MKKLWFLLPFLPLSAYLPAQHTSDTVARAHRDSLSVTIPRELSDSLVSHVRLMVDNTAGTPLSRTDNDDWVILVFSVVAGLLAIPSLYYAVRSYRYTKEAAVNTENTAKNTKELNKEAQEARFRDLIRHLYRNEVCMYALHCKLETEGFDTHYPSEEHLLKLKVLPEDLRLDRFDTNTPQYYDQLHALELLLRNYTIEIDVALEHLKTRFLPAAYKIRDLHTLEFKSQYLTRRIRDLMNATGMTIDDTIIRQLLIQEEAEHRKVPKQSHVLTNIPPRDQAKYRYYDDIGLGDQLDADIAREYGVIQLIAFPTAPEKEPNHENESDE